jgi:phosphatidate cytidylyltransferase
VGATLAFGVFSFLALREFITLVRTRRGDHRSLLLAFFAALPLQYLLVGTRAFDLFTVFVPVYVFLAIPVASALAGDPERFLERNAKIQWGIMVCVYGLSHAPALLLLDLPRYAGRGAFLLFMLVMVTGIAQIVQELASRQLRRRPVARQIDRSFSYRAFGLGVLAAAALGAALFWITPVDPLRAAVIAAVAGGCGNLGELVMRALKKDAGVRYWGNRSSVTGAVGLLDRVAPLCFAAPVFFHSVRWYFV